MLITTRDLQGWYFHFIHSELSAYTEVTELHIVDDIIVPRYLLGSPRHVLHVGTQEMSIFKNVYRSRISDIFILIVH